MRTAPLHSKAPTPLRAITAALMCRSAVILSAFCQQTPATQHRWVSRILVLTNSVWHVFLCNARAKPRRHHQDGTSGRSQKARADSGRLLRLMHLHVHKRPRQSSSVQSNSEKLRVLGLRPSKRRKTRTQAPLRGPGSQQTSSVNWGPMLQPWVLKPVHSQAHLPHSGRLATCRDC